MEASWWNTTQDWCGMVIPIYDGTKPGSGVWYPSHNVISYQCIICVIYRALGDLDRDSCHHIIRSLILSRLDYMITQCSLAPTQKNIARLQKLQNWAAKIILCAKKRDHATPLIKELHWLTVRNRIMYTSMVTVYSPSYLSSTILSVLPWTHRPTIGIWQFTRLTEHRILPRNLSSAADAMFEFATPRQWNSLPATLRTSGSLHTFKKVSKRTSSHINATCCLHYLSHALYLFVYSFSVCFCTLFIFCHCL